VVAWGDVSVAYSCLGVSWMSEQTRDAPSAAKARAVARPIPEEEPVITAILFWRRGSIVGGCWMSEMFGAWLVEDGLDYLCL
jgi:hypothetical protein